MFGWLKQRVKPARGSADDETLVFKSLKKGKCPDCGSKDFYEGPSGGACTNYECAGCGSRFNVGGGFGTLIIGHRIS